MKVEIETKFDCEQMVYVRGTQAYSVVHTRIKGIEIGVPNPLAPSYPHNRNPYALYSLSNFGEKKLEKEIFLTAEEAFKSWTTE